MHIPESGLENETHTILWDFETQTDHLLSARRLDLIIVNKKENLPNSGLCCSGDHGVNLKESEKRHKYLDLARELKKTMKQKSDGDTNCNWYSHKRTSIETGGLENNSSNGDHPNYSIVEIGQNTEKSPRDLRILAPVETHQLMLV